MKPAAKVALAVGVGTGVGLLIYWATRPKSLPSTSAVAKSMVQGAISGGLAPGGQPAPSSTPSPSPTRGPGPVALQRFNPGLPTVNTLLNGKLLVGNISAGNRPADITAGLRANYFDVVMPDGWVLLDATGIQDGSVIAQGRNLGAGDVAAVVLRSNPNAAPQIAHIRVDTNTTPNPMWTFYDGQWLDGPFAYQAAMFTQYHVYKINE